MILYTYISVKSMITTTRTLMFMDRSRKRVDIYDAYGEGWQVIV